MGDGVSSPHGSNGHASPDLVRSEILDRVMSLAAATGAETLGDFGVRADLSQVPASGEFKGGPADVPSDHDFHHLQIAWEDVWTKVVDEDLVADMVKLFHEVVQTVPDVAGDLNDAEVTELNEFVNRLRESIEAASGTFGLVSASPELVLWMPGLETRWPELSAEEKILIQVLYWIDRYPWPSKHSSKTLAEYIATQTKKGPPADWRLTYLWQSKHPLLDGTTIEDVLEQPGTWGHAQVLALLQSKHEPQPATLGRATALLKGILARLGAPYEFKVFQPCTHNFGVITTYRQRWQPRPYQVGELVATMPLAPGEKRTYTKKRSIRTSRAQKEVEKAMWSHHEDSSVTARAEAEILRKASHATNFQLTTEGGFSVGVANASFGTRYGTNQASESSETKKDFREAVRKATQEYRRERTTEISTEVTVTDESSETGEVRNPNDELTVTYLFYELQRRFEVSERLHKVTPVVLIAFDVPAPNEIDEAWLVTHEWIVRRVLLDDTLIPALDYLTQSLAGDEVGVEVLRTRWETQIGVVRELHEAAAGQAGARDEARTRLRKALASYAQSGGGGGLFDTVGKVVFGDGEAGSEEQIAARRRAAQQVLEWVERDLTTAEDAVASAVAALENATEAYTSALQQRLNRRVAIDQLRLHVKQNILYYMQAIWLHEPPDQRYFRIYDKEIEWPLLQAAGHHMVQVSEPNPSWALGIPGEPTTKWQMVLDPPEVLDAKRRLHEVADVDNLLGFKGNYAIFPLRERNAITDFMMQDFVDSYFIAMDPDPDGQLPTPDEALEIAACAWDDASDAQREKITAWLVDTLNNQRRNSEEVVVPTGQLFIEALPGAHPLLEDFKLKHRIIDVHRALADQRRDEFEALRYAARVGAGELGDPEVQTQIQVPDGAGVHVVTPSAPVPTPP